MGKLLLNVNIPAISESFDVFAPKDIPVSSIISVIIENVVNLSNGRYSVSNREMMMTYKPEMLLDPEKSLEDYGVKDGDRVLII